MTAISNPPPAETVTEPDGRVTELFDLPPDEATLLRLFKLLFEEHASEIIFGPCIQGAVFEIHVDQPAELTMLDGYLTVDLGTWHFHLCIGEHRATTGSPLPGGVGPSPAGEARGPLPDRRPVVRARELGPPPLERSGRADDHRVLSQPVPRREGAPAASPGLVAPGSLGHGAPRVLGTGGGPA